MTSSGFHFDMDASRHLLALQGELDDPASAELKQVIADSSDALTSDLAIDLSRVSFMPSPVIGVLATSQAGAQRNGATITFVAPEGSVAARLLTICALDYVTALD